MEYHDATRQLDYVKLALSQNKRHIGFFIGAGCPLSIRVLKKDGEGPAIEGPLIPDVAGLTAEIAQRLRAPNGAEKTAYDRVEEIFAEDQQATFNIEDVLSLIRSMNSVAGNGNVRGLTSDDLEALDKAICAIISGIVDKALPTDGTAYSDLAIWARSLERERPVHVFTTNYDLLMEEALERASAPYFDGFIGARKAFFDLGAVENERLLPSRWLRLWKMHGSINWKISHDEESKRTSIVRTDVIGQDEKLLIYPSHLKYDQSRKMPYLAMLDRVKDFILCPSSILFISGYSFGDDHINDTLLSGLKANPTSMAYAFLFGSMDNPAYAKARLCAEQTPNLVVAAGDQAVIGRKLAPWRCPPSPSADELAVGITNLGEETPENEGRVTCEFTLGDFAEFGKLLRALGRDER